MDEGLFPGEGGELHLGNCMQSAHDWASRRDLTLDQLCCPRNWQIVVTGSGRAVRRQLGEVLRSVGARRELQRLLRLWRPFPQGLYSCERPGPRRSLLAAELRRRRGSVFTPAQPSRDRSRAAGTPRCVPSPRQSATANPGRARPSVPWRTPDCCW